MWDARTALDITVLSAITCCAVACSTLSSSVSSRSFTVMAAPPNFTRQSTLPATVPCHQTDHSLVGCSEHGSRNTLLDNYTKTERWGVQESKKELVVLNSKEIRKAHFRFRWTAVCTLGLAQTNIHQARFHAETFAYSIGCIRIRGSRATSMSNVSYDMHVRSESVQALYKPLILLQLCHGDLTSMNQLRQKETSSFHQRVNCQRQQRY